MSATWVTRPRARIEHKCSLCWRRIEVGERYTRTRGIYDDLGYVFKECVHCRILLSARMPSLEGYLDRDEGYSRDDLIEWTEGRDWGLFGVWRRGWAFESGRLLTLDEARHLIRLEYER